jgi:hypothetical protein
MATLQTSKQASAFTARSRLKQVSRERTTPQLSVVHEGTQAGAVVETVSTMNSAYDHGKASGYREALSEMEQRHLLLQMVTVYKDWSLVSIQHRPESDVLVAHLVHRGDQTDPLVAIREGRTLQIMMDAVGDMKVQYARRQKSSPTNWLTKLRAFFKLNPSSVK